MLGLVVSLLICAVAVSWFVARSVTRRARKENWEYSARFIVMCSMSATTLAVLPYVLLYIVMILREFLVTPGWSLNLGPLELLEGVSAVVILGGLGALSGALYYWLRGRKQMNLSALPPSQLQEII
jgi:L-lactate permease